MITECRTDELLAPMLVPAEELADLLNTSPAGREDDDVEHDELDEDEDNDGEEDEDEGDEDEGGDDDEDDEDEDEDGEDEEDDEEEEDEEEDDEDDDAPRQATGLGSVMLPRLHQLYSRRSDEMTRRSPYRPSVLRHLDCSERSVTNTPLESR